MILIERGFPGSEGKVRGGEKEDYADIRGFIILIEPIFLIGSRSAESSQRDRGKGRCYGGGEGRGGGKEGRE